MKAFVLSISESDGFETDTDILAVVVAYDREEALRLLGSTAAGVALNDITPPTKGVSEEVRRRCVDAMFSDIVLEEMPLVRPSRLV